MIITGNQQYAVQAAHVAARLSAAASRRLKLNQYIRAQTHVGTFEDEGGDPGRRAAAAGISSRREYQKSKSQA